uniref:Pep3/Vps18 beta-propeller domain-containing protein n=1 Tax=Esox lucius TaxID=8010 RepID=A0A6Q2X2E8_ESOLU
MASILDEYEDSQNRRHPVQHSSRFVNVRLEEEKPIFNKQRIDFTPPEKINHFAVCNNQLCMSLGKDTLLRIDLAKPDQPNQIELGRKEDSKVHKLFLDPTGSHLVISLSTSECLYLNRNTQKVRSLSRWRGHLIESVGWNKLLGTETNTGPILVGTSQGIIFEAEISPISVVLTQFHFLLLLPDRVKAICTLNGQVVYEDVFPDKFGPLKKMIKDPVGGLIWIYTEKAVFRYHIQREARDVWQMYMSMNKFDLAKEYCRDRPECMDTVLAKEAEHCFQNKRYMESAKCYALTQNYFEEIALKFIEAKQEEALKEFLLKKLNNLKESEKTQITLLVMWLTELYLNRLGLLESDEGKYGLFLETREEFRKFLCSSKHKECLYNNRTTIYDLLASHGNVDDMVYFSVIMQDYERVISHYCQHDDYGAALEVLSKHCDEKLFYKFSPVLMQHIPKKVVDAWIKMGNRLDPKKLIPALVNYSQMGSTQQINETIRYMEFCVYQLVVTEEAIHNYLLSLYAKYKPDSLLSYLEQAGTHASDIHYDLKYALRLCAEHGYLQACVLVYKIMELYEEAVDLALQVSRPGLSLCYVQRECAARRQRPFVCARISPGP